MFFKSVPLPGSPADLTVSRGGKWFAVIYTAGNDAHVAVFSIDSYGDLPKVATSSAIGAAAFNGVAFSERRPYLTAWRLATVRPPGEIVLTVGWGPNSISNLGKMDA